MIVLTLWLAATPMEANTAGEKLQKAKKYAESLVEFRKAIDLGAGEAPPTLKEQTLARRAVAVAHLNVARSLSLLRKAGKTCDASAYRASILEQVRESLSIDPSGLERVISEPMFSNVRDTLWYQELLGRSPTRDADVRALLTSVGWWTPGAGAYGSTSELRFTPKDVTLFVLELEDGGYPKKQRSVFKGKWVLKNRSFTLTFSKPPPGATKAVLEGTLDVSGTLQVNDLGSFSDSPAECDA